MPFDTWIAFVLASVIVVVSPGPTILLILGDALAHKRQSALSTTSGVAAGDLTTMGLCLIGIGALVSAAPTALDMLRYLGAAYVVFLAIRTIIAARHAAALDDADIKPLSHKRRFYQAWLVTALNPKAILFFVAFVPQFIDTNAPYAPQALTCLITYIVLAFINASAYAVGARSIASRIKTAKAQRRINTVAGSLLLLAGVLMLVL